MESSIERIIANDRRAREAAGKAELQRRKASEELSEKKEAIRRRLEEEMNAGAEKARKRSERERVAETEKSRVRADSIRSGMDALFDEKRSEWIRTYTEMVLGVKK